MNEVICNLLYLAALSGIASIVLLSAACKAIDYYFERRTKYERDFMNDAFQKEAE